MAANIESMFYVREVPWHGLGNRVEEALSSEKALEMAEMNWRVVQKPIQTNDCQDIPGYKVNIRETDSRILGVVTDRYKIVQNNEAFAFTDDLLGEGVKYETAGSLQNGRKVWLLAKLPENHTINEDTLTPYLVFSNSHDGSGSIKVAMTPIRVVCQNTLNLALRNAKRVWSTTHKGDIKSKLDEAKKTILLAEFYMERLKEEVERLNKIKLNDRKVIDYIEFLIPMPEKPSKLQEKNTKELRDELKIRYFEAPDLGHVGKNAYRFINSVSDFATHSRPLRETGTFRENLFFKTIEGNPIIDKAYELIFAAV